LAPQADEVLQVAALFHDIERVWSEADARVEQHASSYDSFKRAHACQSQKKVAELLGSFGLRQEFVGEVACLVGAHDGTSDRTPAIALLEDADSLSFFSLNSWGYHRYFGDDQTARKVAFTLRRMSEDALRELHRFRYHPKVKACLMHFLESER
jgi:hypothetical protein